MTSYYWQEFWGYALGFILWGIASSLRSGAFAALLFEVLDDWQGSSRVAHHSSAGATVWATSMLGLATIGLCFAAQQYRLSSARMTVFR